LKKKKKKKVELEVEMEIEEEEEGKIVQVIPIMEIVVEVKEVEMGQ
jgi:hypothetical protein